MVGYIVGLGDRHGENILVDAGTGDVVHVDYNCIFFRGMTLTVSERVPFRLTRQIVHGLGVTHYESTFRKVSEITMDTLRRNKETLYSTLETLIHDGLVDVKREAAESGLRDIGSRLSGIKRNVETRQEELLLPFSSEGLVDSLIADATANENLSQMFFGWCAFL